MKAGRDHLIRLRVSFPARHDTFDRLARTNELEVTTLLGDRSGLETAPCPQKNHELLHFATVGAK
jgi:hypothetical protein